MDFAAGYGEPPSEAHEKECKLGKKKPKLSSLLVGWRPLLVGWRPSLVSWRPSLVRTFVRACVVLCGQRPEHGTFPLVLEGVPSSSPTFSEGTWTLLAPTPSDKVRLDSYIWC